jgi:hypothetical protein
MAADKNVLTNAQRKENDMPTTCARCKKTDPRSWDQILLDMQDAIHDGVQDTAAYWQGTVNEPVCPDCQMAGYYIHCTSHCQKYGQGEEWCDFVDRTTAYYFDDDTKGFLDEDGTKPPTNWHCPECNGSSFDYVKTDYVRSGLAGTGFEVSDDENHEEDEGEEWKKGGA